MTSNGQYQGSLQYAVDIVMCIDVTGSMHPVLGNVKKSALLFRDRLESVMHEKGKEISRLRLKVIAFRDFADYADDAIEQTDFLVFPEQAAVFDDFVGRLEADGGGDAPESGLEALALAINADWERGLDRRRHVIVMFTDAPAHPLGSPASTAAHTYPPNIPRSMDELSAQWGYGRSQTAVMDNAAKRLVLFAPDISPWTEISEEWSLAMHFPSKAGHGLEEFEMDEIINTIAYSL
ncbi:vWA domain-containing protein [Actinoallomurus soli]|uniref:vWA domain-containing protein n=1 Tax=Actinoallomurus soli TaxID=2952535 RepID=UPI002093E165|nr:vWA domain-containing protein [Actinoallomurus soli]MCO5968317.1 VWA domain-containing protein [Actinoallomurus soli]